jgi:glycosyltransferase involved in cell wall biosynthesis
MKIAYIYPEKLPSKKARAISVVNTAYSMSKVCECSLFTEPYSNCDIFTHYNVVKNNLKIEEISKKILGIKSNKFFNMRLIKKIKKGNFDFVYVRHLKAANYLIKNGIKVVFECHEIFHMTNEKTKNIEKFVIENSSGLTFINETLKKQFEQYFDIQSLKKSVIHNGCNFNLEFMDKHFGAREVFYIGSLFDWKGVDFLVRCMRFFPNIKLNIIGDTENTNKLLTIIEKYNLNNITFLGYKNHLEVKNILKYAALTVIPNTPSKFSNFSIPIKLYEYLASSSIVIASDIPTIKEVIDHGKNGFLFKSGCEKNFVKQINYILSYDASQLKKVSMNAYNTSKLYTWDNRATNLLNFLKILN